MKLRFRIIGFVFNALLLLVGVTAQAKQLESEFVEIVKSPADSREYRAITLDNGLKVMLISDVTSDRAAAALDVYVGSGNDPLDRQGLAHYLEHMLFLGTEKYPEPGEYQQYISENGGSNNAYTVLNHTNYFFNITPDFLEGALDRFAQFFIAPSFNEAYVKRERSVVNSEYRARKDDEIRRLWTARRVVYNPKHPSTKFTVGSLETLADREGDPVREDLITFYERNYHAPRMALSVASKHSLDQLQAWVEAKFTDIPNGGEAYSPFDVPLVLPSKLPVQLTLKPVKDTRQVTFSFPIDSVQGMEDSKPGHYLSNLLGHEGEGSLLALLKSRTWANSLNAGMGFSDDVQATFDINISLSEQGFGHVEEIGSLLFSYIEMIREHGVKAVYHEELAQLAELDFRFQEKSSENHLVQRLASQLHRYKAREVLSAPYLYENFKPERIRKILERLRPDNLQLIITDPQLESVQKTDWYNVAYTVSDLNSAWLTQWQSAEPTMSLALPDPNPFIADQLEILALKDKDSGHPVKLKSISNVQVWHQTELEFEQPKAALYFSLRSPAANSSPRHAILTELYAKSVEEAMSAYYYPAYLAGLDYQIYRHSRGLSVRISGYSAKQAQLLEKVVDEMLSVQINQQRFALYVENIEKAIKNSLKGRPSEMVISGVYDVLLTSSWSAREKLDAIQGIDLDALVSHMKALLDVPELLVLSLGNVSEDDSLRAGQIVSRLTSVESVMKPVVRAKVRKLNSGKWTLLDSAALPDDAAIALIYQGKTADMAELAATQLLGSLIHTPYYQALRTEAQLGYIVQAFAFNVLDAPALGFSVQSNNHSVSDIVSRTEQFLSDYKNTLAQLPEATFAATKVGLIAQLTKEDKQLGDRAERYWAELDREAYDFDTRERLVAAIENLDKAALLRYFNQLLATEEAAVLLSYSYGNKSTKIDFPETHEMVQFDSLEDLRRAVNEYF
jgi:insulysin